MSASALGISYCLAASYHPDFAAAWTYISEMTAAVAVAVVVSLKRKEIERNEI